MVIEFGKYQIRCLNLVYFDEYYMSVFCKCGIGFCKYNGYFVLIDISRKKKDNLINGSKGMIDVIMKSKLKDLS